MTRKPLYSYRSRLGKQKSTRRSPWAGRIRLGALFLALVGVNIYVFFFRSGTSIHDVLKASAIQGAKSTKRAGATGGPGLPDADDELVFSGTMKGKNGLFVALEGKIDAAQATELVAALRQQLDMRNLRPRHTYELRIDPTEQRLRSFVYRLSPVEAVKVTRKRDGELAVERVEARLTTRVQPLGGRIHHSLRHTVKKNGEAGQLAAMLTDLLSWDVNWYTDPRDGDEFRLLVEKRYLGDRFYQYGRILAAEYRGRMGTLHAFYHEAQDGQGGYYTADGRSVRRALLKTPLRYRRLDSGRDRRGEHPLLHTTRGHYGVDYAAPRGTPVWAAGDGTVTSAGRAGGAGNMVVIRHHGGRHSLYLHLHRIMRGIRPGARVQQQQAIGTVGSTGLASGPHLHYGIRVDGRYVDPIKYKLERGPTLPAAERARFIAKLPALRAKLDAIAVSDN